MQYKVIGGKHHGKWIDLVEELPRLQLADPIELPRYRDIPEAGTFTSRMNISWYRPMKWHVGHFHRTIYVPVDWSDERVLLEMIERC